MKIKRTIFLFTILAVWVAAISAQTVSQPNSLDMENLVGKVKRIDEQTAEMRLQNGVLKEVARTPSRIVAFDKKGRMIYRWLKIEELPTFETKFSYEKDGQRIERTLRNNLPSELTKNLTESIGKSVFHYVTSEHALYRDVYPGEQANVNEPPRFNAQTQKYKYIFGDDNRLLETIDYFSDNGEEATHDKNIYKDKRLPIQCVLITKGIPFKETIKYNYTLDEQGNWTKRVSEDTLADKNGTTISRVEYRKITYYK